VEKKTALITGGAGFLGSHLADLYLDANYRVICIDNLITGNRDNIAHNLTNSDFNFVEADICTAVNIPQNIDLLLHFASPASPIDYLKLPLETLRVGSVGTWNALELARQKQARFLMASTSEVYGDPLQNPQNEKYWGNVNPIGPRSVYDESKRFSEALTMAYYRKYGLDTRIVRIFNTYGPRMRKDDRRIVPMAITQSLKNEPLTIFGDGQQTRSFCYVSDLINGIFKLSQAETHEPVNIGSPLEYSMLELADKIIDLCGSRSTLIFQPLPQDDPKLRQPDITRAQQLLKWNPQINLEEGLNLTIEWFRQS
jgi:dTDP-glucose 4,6-dehydratase